MLNAIMVALYVLVFLLGASIGSFLNVLVWRIPQKMQFVSGRSICTACGAQIKAYDLIPILSYLFLGGKCRNCKEKIPLRYPCIEALTGILFVLCFWRFDFTLATLVSWAAAALLLTIAAIDHDTMEIPNGLVIALIVPAFASIFAFSEIGIAERLIGMVIISVPMALLALVVAGAFGGGDIKLMAICGFMLGFKFALVAMFFAVLTGGIYGVYLLARGVSGKKQICFGPHLCFGIFTALLFGGQIITLYLTIAFR